MRALCWEGVDKVSVQTVPDPRIENVRDVIVKVTASSVCGSDLHQWRGEFDVADQFLAADVDVFRAANRRRR